MWATLVYTLIIIQIYTFKICVFHFVNQISIKKRELTLCQILLYDVYRWMSGWMIVCIYMWIDNFIFFIYIYNLTWAGNTHTYYKTGCFWERKKEKWVWFGKIQRGLCCFCSVTRSCLTLWKTMDSSTPGSSVLHQLPEFAQIHVHWVGDAI